MGVGQHVRSVIEHQGAAWREALGRVHPLDPTVSHLFTGSGSSYYVAQAAAAVGRRVGAAVAAVPAAELCLEPDQALAGVDRVVVISRSGATTEALWAAEAARQRGAAVAAVSADPASPLVRAVPDAVASPAWEDDAVVMVRSCTGFLLWLEASLGQGTGRGDWDPALWADAFDQALMAGRALAGALPGCPRRLVLLGGGVREGIAREGMLKVTEMAHVATAAYHPLEFRHGPRGALAPGDWVVLLGQAAFAAAEAAVLRDIAGQGARLAVVGREAWFAGSGPVPEDLVRVALPDRPGDLWNGPAALVPLQVLAWELAVRAGEDPDRPANLSKVVQLPGIPLAPQPAPEV